jgi:hypothetical protein
MTCGFIGGKGIQPMASHFHCWLHLSGSFASKVGKHCVSEHHHVDKNGKSAISFLAI